MKKILAFVFLFSLILPATFAQKYQKDSTGYRGVAVIDASIIGDGGVIVGCLDAHFLCLFLLF